MPFGICPSNSLGLLPTPHSVLLRPEGALGTLASQLSSEEGCGEALKGHLRFTLQEFGPAPPRTPLYPKPRGRLHGSDPRIRSTWQMYLGFELKYRVSPSLFLELAAFFSHWDPTLRKGPSTQPPVPAKPGWVPLGANERAPPSHLGP